MYRPAARSGRVVGRYYIAMPLRAVVCCQVVPLRRVSVPSGGVKPLCGVPLGPAEPLGPVVRGRVAPQGFALLYCAAASSCSAVRLSHHGRYVLSSGAFDT